MTLEQIDEKLTQAVVDLRKSLRIDVLLSMAIVAKPEGGWLRMLRISSDPLARGTYEQLAGILRDAADDLEKLDQEEIN